MCAYRRPGNLILMKRPALISAGDPSTSTPRPPLLQPFAPDGRHTADLVVIKNLRPNRPPADKGVVNTQRRNKTTIVLPLSNNNNNDNDKQCVCKSFWALLSGRRGRHSSPPPEDRAVWARARTAFGEPVTLRAANVWKVRRHFGSFTPRRAGKKREKK